MSSGLAAILSLMIFFGLMYYIGNFDKKKNTALIVPFQFFGALIFIAIFLLLKG